MLLKTHRWGPERADAIVCIHGLMQHGRVFSELGETLAAAGHSVVSVDLRGHGGSGIEPPWNVETHLDDLFSTLTRLGIERQTWLGHSFGGRLAAAAAARREEQADRVVLLDPGLHVPPERALRGAETDRLDWSFASPEGALNALLSGPMVVAAPREVVASFVRDDVRRGPDGRYRFGFCPSAVVAAWSEVALPAPPIARLPTLVVRAEVPLVPDEEQAARYRRELGDLLHAVTVPNGHNMLWESPRETIEAVEGFVGQRTCVADAPAR